MIPGKNDIVTLTITDIGENGEGIGKADGFTLFIKGAVVGDVVEARVLKAKKTYGYAKIERMLTPSKDRVAASCPVAGRCGGCQLSQMNYESQKRFKEAKVRACMERIGGITFDEQTEFFPILGMENRTGYRNKEQFPVGRNRNGDIVTGFYASHSHDIISCKECKIGAPVNAAICETIRAHMAVNHVMPYNEEENTGLVRHILTRVGAATGEVLVCLIINGTGYPKAEQLAQQLEAAVKSFAETSGSSLILKGFCLNVNREKTNVILGDQLIPVWGQTYITDRIGDISYRISPLSFYQVNPKQTKVLYDKALEFAGLTGNEIVWDLYCGIGTISLFLAKSAKQVYGVEIVPPAIEDAKQNAERNRITNAEFFVGAAEEVLPEKYKESNQKMRADVICVDPPRKGCDESLLATLVAMEPKRIVYVSCDPATLARDVHYLQERGFQLKKVQPVDMFPETVHVETVCLLARVNPGGRG